MKAFVREEPKTQAKPIRQVGTIISGLAPFFSEDSVRNTASACNPLMWRKMHSPGSNYDIEDLRMLSLLLLYLSPTSASGEKSFMQQARVHNKIRNREIMKPRNRKMDEKILHVERDSL